MRRPRKVSLLWIISAGEVDDEGSTTDLVDAVRQTAGTRRRFGTLKRVPKRVVVTRKPLSPSPLLVLANTLLNTDSQLIFSVQLDKRPTRMDEESRCLVACK